jgi:hypothetical protein
MSDLEQRIRAELMHAGFTVLVQPHDEQSGVSVATDEDGVWVDWEPGRQLLDASMAAFRRGAYRGEERHPALAHRHRVGEVMQDAIATLLRGTGFEVVKDADEYRNELLVVSHSDGPHWQDPIGQELDGLSGFIPGITVRVTAGQWTGRELGIVKAGTRSDGDHEVPTVYCLQHPDSDELIRVAPQHVEFAVDPLYPRDSR